MDMFIPAAIGALAVWDFSSVDLAILAAGFVAGLGLGLWPIFRDLFAGLLLATQRTIRVGDWIAVRAHEGVVRRMGARTTEIEMADQASVILPNALLASEPVVRAHRRGGGQAGPADRGRWPVAAKVSVAHGSDPERVLEALRAAVGQAPLIVQDPAPVIRFDAIDGSGLEFSVRGARAAGADAAEAEAQLRGAVVTTLLASGVELGHPRTDVYLRDLDQLRTFLARLAEARARQPGSGDLV